jgi:hypothetical protein
MPEPLLIQARYRNRLERGVGEQLSAAGVPFAYEREWVRYTVPEREAKYLPDFWPDDTNIIIETKGWFGRQGAKERQKLVLLKEQHPELDIRIVFSDANKRIYAGSPTTYAQWADDHGFKWATKGVVPRQWINDLKKEREKCKQTLSPRPSPPTSSSPRKRGRSSPT